MFGLGIVIIMMIIAAVCAVIAIKLGRDAKELRNSSQDNSYSHRDEQETSRTSKIFSGISVGAAVFGVIILAMITIVNVGPTEVGVPVSIGQVGEPIGPGMHTKTPWATIETYPTRPVVVELAGENKVQARTADAGQVNVEVATRWKVDPAQAQNLYLQVRTGDDDAISQDLVVKNLRQAVGTVYSQMGSLVALNDRAKVTQEIQATLAEQLTPYGISVEDVNLRSVEPDEKTAAVVARRANQQQETQIAIEAKKTAEIEAQRRKIEAEGLKKAAGALKGLTPAEVSMLCQQTWERAVSKTTDAGIPLYTSPCAGGNTSVIAGGIKSQ